MRSLTDVKGSARHKNVQHMLVNRIYLRKNNRNNECWLTMSVFGARMYACHVLRAFIISASSSSAPQLPLQSKKNELRGYSSFKLGSGRGSRTRPTLSHLLSFKIRSLTFLNYTKNIGSPDIEAATTTAFRSCNDTGIVASTRHLRDTLNYYS